MDSSYNKVAICFTMRPLKAAPSGISVPISKTARDIESKANYKLVKRVSTVNSNALCILRVFWWCTN